MNILLAVAAAASLSATPINATLSDHATARTNVRSSIILTDAESSGSTRGGHDTAMMAEANGASPGGRDTALG